jgi:hypothetical protein
MYELFYYTAFWHDGESDHGQMQLFPEISQNFFRAILLIPDGIHNLPAPAHGIAAGKYPYARSVA